MKASRWDFMKRLLQVCLKNTDISASVNDRQEQSLDGIEELLNEITAKMLANFLRNIVELRLPQSCHRP
jgi:hypothetical protein